MPFRHAHWVLLALLVFALLAFWPSYLSRFSESSVAFHLHGVTGFLWIVLLAAQSFAIHGRRPGLHRTLGLSVFALFPVFTAGGVLVVKTMAEATVAGNPFNETFGARLGAIDFFSTIAVAGLLFMALRERRTTRLHAGYMLATAFFLSMPVFTRLLTSIPPFEVSGPADFPRFGQALHVTVAATALYALVLWLRDRRGNTPMLVIAVLVALESVLFELVGRTDAWRALFFGIGHTPAALLVGVSWTAALLVMLAGWGAPPRPARAVAA